jgi:hypothetical protein
MMEDEKCPICKGTGFIKGKICVCISGETKDIGLPEGWDEIFGNLFKNPKIKKEI